MAAMSSSSVTRDTKVNNHYGEMRLRQIERASDCPTSTYVGICDPCKTWMEAAIGGYLRARPEQEDQLVAKSSVSRSYLIHEAPTTRTLRDVINPDPRCWICHETRRLVEDARSGAFQSVQDSEEINLKITFEFVEEWPAEPCEIVTICLGDAEGRPADQTSIMFVKESVRPSPSLNTITYAVETPSEDAERNGVRLAVQAGGKLSPYLARLLAAQASSTPMEQPVRERLDGIRAWLHECDATHTCRSSSTGLSSLHKTPPRLLHISPDAQDVRLLERGFTGWPENGRYSTLSYCWGPDKPLLLVTGTLLQLKAGVQVRDLGRTFREAVHLSHGLGIMHIWIDCLCIIQDSQDSKDWLSHAPIMHSIYGNSYLNIAASASRSWTESLWRPVDAVEHCEMAIDLGNGRSMYSTDPTDGAERRGSRLIRLSRDYRTTPIFDRGWCVQEFYFSPRTVHMVASQMYWNCRSHRWGEVTTADSLPGRPTMPPFFSSRSRLDGLWQSLAESFSETNVTFAQDRIHALSGAVAHFKGMYDRRGVKTSYYFGLWTHRLPASLLWFPQDKTPRTQYERLSLPSWSWLRSGGVKFANLGESDSRDPPPTANHLARFVDVDLACNSGVASLDATAAPSLHLQGPLLRITHREGSSDRTTSPSFLLSQESSTLKFVDGDVFDIPYRSEDNRPGWRYQVYANGAYFFEDSSERQLREHMDFVIAPIAWLRSADGGCSAIDALALEPCSPPHGSDGPTYRRIGALAISLSPPKYGSGGIGVEKTIKDTCKQDPRPSPPTSSVLHDG